MGMTAGRSTRRAHANVIDALSLPRVVQLTPNLFVACFSLMKLLPATYMVRAAKREGVLCDGQRIVETTSGTFGLALALVCRVEGNPLHLVSDAAIDAPLRQRLEDLQATVEVVAASNSSGVQAVRLRRVDDLLASDPSLYWPSQYHSLRNAEAYGPVAEIVAETVGEVDMLVGAVGSGGSMCGTAGYLRGLSASLDVVGVDTPGSVLFGHEDRPRDLRGLGNSLMPRNLRHEAFDEVHWVTASEAFQATRDLNRQHGIFMGPTSGAAFLVASWAAAADPSRRVVALLPDDGSRYQSTVYDDGWLAAHGYVRSAGAEPVVVDHPRDAPADRWSRMAWSKRSLGGVVADLPESQLWKGLTCPTSPQ